MNLKTNKSVNNNRKQINSLNILILEKYSQYVVIIIATVNKAHLQKKKTLIIAL